MTLDFSLNICIHYEDICSFALSLLQYMLLHLWGSLYNLYTGSDVLPLQWPCHWFVGRVVLLELQSKPQFKNHHTFCIQHHLLHHSAHLPTCSTIVRDHWWISGHPLPQPPWTILLWLHRTCRCRKYLWQLPTIQKRTGQNEPVRCSKCQKACLQWVNNVPDKPCKLWTVVERSSSPFTWPRWPKSIFHLYDVSWKRWAPGSHFLSFLWSPGK